MILISDEHKIVWPEVEIEVKDGLDVYPFYNDEMSAIIENLIWKEEAYRFVLMMPEISYWVIIENVKTIDNIEMYVHLISMLSVLARNPNVRHLGKYLSPTDNNEKELKSILEHNKPTSLFTEYNFYGEYFVGFGNGWYDVGVIDALFNIWILRAKKLVCIGDTLYGLDDKHIYSFGDMLHKTITPVSFPLIDDEELLRLANENKLTLS